MEHEATIWYVVNPREVQDAYGLPMPVGWAWLCECGSVAPGFVSRYLAEVAQLVHKRFDSFVYTWLGDAPDRLVNEVRRRGALGRVGYTWGGMDWSVTVGLDWPEDQRVSGSRRPFVRLEYGDVVTVIGTGPDVNVLVWRRSTGETFT